MQLSLDIPEEAFSILRVAPDVFLKEMRLAAAVKWYEIGKISQAKAAELAGVNRQEFIEALATFGVSALQITPQELTAEFERDVRQLGRQ
jgi:predicted HTH domain antitoxin